MSGNFKTYLGSVCLVWVLLGCALEFPKPPTHGRSKGQEAIPLAFSDLLLLEKSWLQTLYQTKKLIGLALFSEELIERAGIHPQKNCIQLVKFDDGEGELVGDFIPSPCHKDLVDAKEIVFTLQPVGLNGRDFALTLGDMDRGYGVAERDLSTGIVTVLELCDQFCELVVEKGRLLGIDISP